MYSTRYIRLMKQKHLEIILEQVSGFESPSSLLEQYSTPAPIAAAILYLAKMKNDLIDTVYDLGCGTGILSIGAALLGAPRVVGFDVDNAALEIARKNAKNLNVSVEFVCCCVDDVFGGAHAVIMNPPFGAQVKGSDRPFLTKALEIARVVYSIHNAGSHEFIKKFIYPAVITDKYYTVFPIKRTFKFHEKDKEIINVEIYRITSYL